MEDASSGELLPSVQKRRRRTTVSYERWTHGLKVSKIGLTATVNSVDEEDALEEED